jgi:hypothetical protein
MTSMPSLVSLDKSLISFVIKLNPLLVRFVIIQQISYNIFSFHTTLFPLNFTFMKIEIQKSSLNLPIHNAFECEFYSYNLCSHKYCVLTNASIVFSPPWPQMEFSKTIYTLWNTILLLQHMTLCNHTPKSTTLKNCQCSKFHTSLTSQACTIDGVLMKLCPSP